MLFEDALYLVQVIATSTPSTTTWTLARGECDSPAAATRTRRLGAPHLLAADSGLHCPELRFCKRLSLEYSATMNDPGDEKGCPTWDGSGGETQKLAYLRWAEGHVRGSLPDDRQRAVIRLWRALQGTAALRLEDMSFERMAAATAEGELCNGWNYLRAELDRAFPEGQLRQLP